MASEDIFHVHSCYYPFVCGISNRIRNVIHHTFSLDRHTVVALSGLNQEIDSYTYDGVRVQRFPYYSPEEYYRLIQLSPGPSSDIQSFVKYIRSHRPGVLALYQRFLFHLVMKLIPESRVVYMPIVYLSKEKASVIHFTKRIRIVLFGDAVVQKYLDIGIPEEQIYILERPIDTDFFQPLNTHRDPYRLLFVGRISPEKRIPEFLQVTANVFHDYPQLHLYIVGDIDSEYSVIENPANEIQRIQETERELGLTDRVIFRGKCIGDDLLREYSEASIHILPSVYDIRNTATQEALTMGLQCLNIRINEHDWPEFTPDERRLIHYVSEFNEFDPTLRHILNSNPNSSVRDYIENQWSWTRWRTEYEKVFTEWD